MVTTAYTLSFAVFRSRVFAGTLGLCFALTTFNHHVYDVSGTVAMPLIVCYLMFFLFCQYKLLEPGCRLLLWVPIGVLSMLLYALAYEGWLDCVACMGLVYPFLIVLAWRAGEYRRAKVAAAILLVTMATMIGYVALKRSMGDGQGAGSESDVVFNYGRSYWLLAVEDVIGHLFTHFFVTITTYTPPLFFNGSVSSWKFGTEQILALQNGYHLDQTHLLRYHHLFYWRFYAGFAAAMVLFGLWKNVRACWRMPSLTSVGVFVFLMMTLLSGATHSIVKERPMHSAPFLGYHSYFGVVGFSLLLALAAWWMQRNFQRRWLAWSLIALLWLNLGYCALIRPAFLSHMAVQCGFNPYPDAWQNFKNTIRPH